MILSMSNQAFIFGLSLICGVTIAFIYDVLRIFRNIIKHNAILTNLEDIIYWIIVSFCVFYIMFNQNNGEIRGFIVMASFSGMILYFIIASPFILKMSDVVIKYIKMILKFIFKITTLPFKLIYKLLEVPRKIIQLRINKTKKNSKILLHKTQKYVTIKRQRFFNDINILLKKH